MKYLGVLVDENLSWKHHINYISTKISQGIGIIARLWTLGTTHYSSKHLLLAHRTAYFLWSRCFWSSRECSFKQSCHFTKVGSSFNVFLRLYISQCSSFCLFGNSTDKNALLQIGCLSVTWHQNQCVPPNISQLFTCSEQVHSYSTRLSVAWSFYIKQVRTNHQFLSFSRVGAKI